MKQRSGKTSRMGVQICLAARESPPAGRGTGVRADSRWPRQLQAAGGSAKRVAQTGSWVFSRKKPDRGSGSGGGQGRHAIEEHNGPPFASPARGRCAASP